MALDRPLTITVTGMGDYSPQGVYLPGVAVVYEIYGTPIDISVGRVLDGNGARLDSDRIFRVRWFEELALAPVTSIALTDELGLTYTVTKVEEYVGRFGEMRRRWLDVESTREAAN